MVGRSRLMLGVALLVGAMLDVVRAVGAERNGTTGPGQAADGAGSVHRLAPPSAQVAILTPRPGRVVIAEDADGDGQAEAIAIADDVTPFDAVPAYRGAGLVLRNDAGLTVVASGLARNLSFTLSDGPSSLLGDAPAGAAHQPRQRFTAHVLDAYPAVVSLSALGDVFEHGPVAACLPSCTRLPSSSALGSCAVTCRHACAACGRWRGSERCTCVPAR